MIWSPYPNPRARTDLPCSLTSRKTKTDIQQERTEFIFDQWLLPKYNLWYGEIIEWLTLSWQAHKRFTDGLPCHTWICSPLRLDLENIFIRFSNLLFKKITIYYWVKTIPLDGWHKIRYNRYISRFSLSYDKSQSRIGESFGSRFILGHLPDMHRITRFTRSNCSK